MIDERTAAEFAAENPILKYEQTGRETDTNKTKVGDGVLAWNSLDYTGLVLIQNHIELNPELKNSTEEGITAFAGGGQANATVITSHYNVVETVATNGDSAKLTAAIKNSIREIFNTSAKDLALFPATGERFKQVNTLLAINASITIKKGNSLRLICYTNGIWRFT